MAVVKFVSPVEDLRGTIGGVTYSRNASRAYCKTWGAQPYKRTSSQSTARNNLAQGITGWRDLTDGQRTAWAALAASPPEIDYDRWGTQVFLSGLQWYTRIASRLLRVGRALDPDPPVGLRPDAAASFTVTVEVLPSTVQECEYANSGLPGDYDDILWCALTRGPSRQAAWNQYRIVKAEAPLTPSVLPFHDVFAKFFPFCNIGDQFFAVHRIQRPNGLRSQDAVASTSVAAES